MEHRLFKIIRSYSLVAVLAIVMALSYQLFVFPNAFAPAGINGLATMVQYLFDFSIGYMSLLINLPLILLALSPNAFIQTLIFWVFIGFAFTTYLETVLLQPVFRELEGDKKNIRPGT